MPSMRRAIAILETFWRELQYATRTLRKNPGFAATAVVGLALGIGGNTVMFSMIRAVLLRPLEYSDPDRLVRVSVDNPRFQAVDSTFSLDQFEQMRAARSFSGFGAFLSSAEDMTFSGKGAPEALKGARVSANFLEVLGVQPALGRSFRAEEDRSGGPAVAMISTRLWMRRFGGSPRIAGARATINAVPHTIVGVLPAGFEFPIEGVDVWLTRPSEWSWLPSRYWRNVTLLIGFARLKPDIRLEQARAELNVLRNEYTAAHPAELMRGNTTMRVARLQDQMTANVRSMLWMLFGAVGCVLLIACANIAGLLLARAASRSREFAVRAAIGAGRRDLVRQLLTESLVLSLTGGLFGVLLARWGVGAIAALSGSYATRTGPMLPRASGIRLDGGVLLFTLALSVATGVLFGLFPSLRSSRPDLAAALRQSGAAVMSGGRARWILVAGQTALSIVLLIGAALLLESFARLHAVDPGFQTENLLTMKVGLPPARYDTDRKKTAFFNELVPRIEGVPGIRDAAASLSLPTTSWIRTNVEIIGQPEDLHDQKFGVLQSVSPGYFRALGIPLRRGRAFTERDNQPGAPAVIIINEALARRLWPAYPGGPNPVGQHLFEGADKAAGRLEVIGIAADVHEGGLASDAVPEFYVPLVVHPPQMAYLAVRTSGDPRRFLKAIRGQVLAIDGDQPVSEIRTMTELFEASVGPRRLALLLLSAFAGVALLLASIGIYGVMAYSVAQRSQELGIRRALGAQQEDILRLVLRRGLALALAGIVIGSGGAFALTRVLAGLLFHVKPSDPLTFLGIGALFLLVALGASYFPALRATRVDPMTALRVS